jgi:tetratricopeptide (TPR) repeat protein
VTRPIPVPESEFTEAVRTARAGRHGQAIEQIERLTHAGALPPVRRIAAVDALAHISRLAEAAGDAAQAAMALEVALRLRSDYPDLHYRRARLLLRLQRRPEARRELERALALNARYTAARLDLALLDAAEGCIGEALESLRALARETVVERPLAFQQGLESLERADWEEAGVFFSGALALGRCWRRAMPRRPPRCCRRHCRGGRAGRTCTTCWARPSCSAGISTTRSRPWRVPSS